jgi:hypothetical protein
MGADAGQSGSMRCPSSIGLIHRHRPSNGNLIDRL